MGHKIFKTFISSASQIMIETIYCKNIGQIHPSNNRFKFLFQITSLGIGALQNTKILATYSSFTDNSKFLYTLANLIISRLVVIYELWLYQSLTISLWLKAKGIFQNVACATNQVIFTRVTLVYYLVVTYIAVVCLVNWKQKFYLQNA